MSDKPVLNAEQAARMQERKEELKSLHEEYLHDHPEVRHLMGDFMAEVLFEKPDDVLEFAKNFFTNYKPGQVAE